MGRASGPRAARLPGRFQTTGRGRRETGRPLHTRSGEDAAGAGSGSGPAWQPPETCCRSRAAEHPESCASPGGRACPVPSRARSPRWSRRRSWRPEIPSCSAEIGAPSARMSARPRALWSSLMFPGHAWASRRCRAASLRPGSGWPSLAPNWRTKCRPRSGSRSHGPQGPGSPLEVAQLNGVAHVEPLLEPEDQPGPEVRHDVLQADLQAILAFVPPLADDEGLTIPRCAASADEAIAIIQAHHAAWLRAQPPRGDSMTTVPAKIAPARAGGAPRRPPGRSPRARPLFSVPCFNSCAETRHRGAIGAFRKRPQAPGSDGSGRWSSFRGEASARPRSRARGAALRQDRAQLRPTRRVGSPCAREGQRARSTAARVSRVGTSPQHATTTSGSSPRSLQAPPHMPSPAAPFDMCVLNDVDSSWSSSSSAEIGESRLNDVLNHRNDDRRRHTEQDHSTGGFERSEESP